jgi:hypothetical protein
MIDGIQTKYFVGVAAYDKSQQPNQQKELIE